MEEILIVVVAVIVTLMLHSNIQLNKEITRINLKLRKINLLIGDRDPVLGIEDEIKELLIEGKKIQAIKTYRMATGFGLKESKEYVDSVKKELKMKKYS